MGAAFAIVWGVALLVIAVLLVVLALALKRGPALASSGAGGAEAFEAIKDALLFYYEENSVRSTTRDRIIVRIPGIAWEMGWKGDLLRLEVNAADPGSVALPPEWSEAQILAVYDLRAYRMTEMGTDVEVERFLAPIDVVLTVKEVDPGLRLIARTDSAWVLAPTTEISPDEFKGSDLPSDRNWIAISVTRLGQICLIRLPSDLPVADREPQDTTQ